MICGDTYSSESSMDTPQGGPYLSSNLTTMGIPDLWTIVSPSRQLASLQDLSYRHLQETGRYLILGVDISIWFAAAQTGLKSKNIKSHAQLGQNPELRNIFQRISRLSTLPIALVVIFDGPARPGCKRNSTVRKTPHWMTSRSKEILQGFGHSYYMAPGEAEAELAHLSKINCIDAVFTDDSDTLVFGATWVIRNPHDKTDPDKSTTPIMQDGLLLFALLRGGDYGKGLNNCGKVIAYGLTKTSLGSRLRMAAEDYTAHQLRQHLDGKWRDDLMHQLEHDPHAFIGRKNPRLALSVPSHFPDTQTILRYTSPLISSSRPLVATPDINVQRLSSLCEQLFGWDSETVINRFRKHVFPGICIHELLKGTTAHIAGLHSVKRTKTGIVISAKFNIPRLLNDEITLCLLWLPATIFKVASPLVVALLRQYKTQRQTDSVVHKITLLHEILGQIGSVENTPPSQVPSLPPSASVIDLTEESDDDAAPTNSPHAVIDLTAF
ncbi:PIN domain-like protein [Dendrothele bispora CBS 962.96]|uniref:PIN domain-like protein n=1 Tax=Dendrothele bispora (strain CBS 962.96) TaxID=1314807 RepID=A0A4S8MC56_DENBC|nr:PIN domain-like protein [Dendrothele bispora CBS 962.96]